MPGMVCEKVGVLAHDRAPQLGRRIAGDDGERHLRPDARDGEELLEELALLRVREAEELHGVLADVEVRLDDDLVGPVGLLDRRRRRQDAIADAVDVEDEALCVAGHRLAAEPRDHRRPPATAMSGGASAWQIATARASAAWCGLGISVRPSTARTIRCI